MFNANSNNLLQNKKLLVTFAIALICLALSIVFPSRSGFQSLTGELFFFIFIPILYIKLVLGKKISDFGWNVQNRREGFFWGICMLLTTLLIFYLLFKFTGFGKNYSLPVYVANNFWLFLVYETIFVNFFVFTQEFFFRGFVLFSFIPKLSYGAIPLQFFFGAFGLFLAGSFTWQFAPVLIISATSGIIAYKSRSFIYSCAAAFLSTLILDSFLIYNFK